VVVVVRREGARWDARTLKTADKLSPPPESSPVSLKIARFSKQMHPAAVK
jgi:hypothetical protein